MLKVTLIPSGGINISYGNTPVMVSALHLGADEAVTITETIHAIKDPSGEKITSLTYNGERITFFKHGQPVYIKDFPATLMGILKLLQAEIAPLYA